MAETDYKIKRIFETELSAETFSFVHDYGKESLPWETISHLCSARLKKEPKVYILFIFVYDHSDVYVIDSSSFNFKQSLGSNCSPKRETNFLTLAGKIVENATKSFIDWPLKDSLQVNLKLLPEFPNIHKARAYAVDIRLNNEFQNTPVQSAEPTSEYQDDSLPILFKKRLGNFQAKKELALRSLPKIHDFVNMAENERINLGDKQKYLESAVNIAEKAIETSRGMTKAYIDLAEIYKYMSLQEKSIETYRKAISLDPTFSNDKQQAVSVYFALAELYYVFQEEEKESQTFSKYYGLFPGYIPESIIGKISGDTETGEEWYQHFEQGYQHLAAQQYGPALDSFNNSLILLPSFSWTHYWKGICYRQMEQDADALESFETSAGLAEDPLTLLEIGILHKKQGNPEEAKEYFEKVLRAAPLFLPAYYHMAVLLFEAFNQKAESFEYLLQATEIDPDTPYLPLIEELVKKLSQSAEPKPSLDVQVKNEWEVGTVISHRYEIQQIFYGGMGVVYIVKDLDTPDIYALKSFQDRFLWQDNIIRMFNREAEVWVRLGVHKNIVHAIMVKNLEGKPFIFLEYIKGTDLEKELQQRQLSIENILDYALQFCKGMNYAYNRLGIIHQDIKPSNCLITQDGVLKITDFGLVKILKEQLGEKNIPGAGQSSSAGDSNVAGTLPYMAPEQFQDRSAITTATDIYSFGAMLYEMITGNPPFGTEIETCISGHLVETAVNPCRLRPDVPRELGEIVMRCLNKEPSKRYEDFGELLMALNDVFEKTCKVQHEDLTGKDYRDSDSIENVIHRGEALMALKKYTDADIFFDEALKQYPHSPILLMNKAECLLKLKRVLEAKQYSDMALGLDMSNPDIFFYRGSILAALKDYQEAYKCYKIALSMNPEKAETWARLGALYDMMGYTNEAVNCYDKALGLNEKLADVWNNKGNLFLRTDKTSNALECYMKAIEINPRNTISWFNIGLLQQRMNNHKDALKSFKKVLDINKDYTKAWLGSGISNFKLGMDETALQCYEKVLQKEKHNTQALLYKAECLLAMKRSEEAALCMQKALKPGERPVDWTTLMFTLADIQDYQGALNACNEALKLSPDNAALSSYKITIEDRLNLLKTYAKYAATPIVMKIDPAESFAETADYDMLKNRYLQLLAGDPENAFIKFKLAVIYGVTGQQEQAQAMLEQSQTYSMIDRMDFTPIAQAYAESFKDTEPREKKGFLGRSGGKTDLKAFQKAFDEAKAFYRERKYAEMLASLTRASQHNRDSMEMWKLAAVCCYELKKYDNALEFIHKAMAKNIFRLDLWLLKSKILIKMNRITDAARTLFAAMAGSPEQYESVAAIIRLFEELDYLNYSGLQAARHFTYLTHMKKAGYRVAQTYLISNAFLMKKYVYAKEIISGLPPDQMNLTCKLLMIYALLRTKETADAEKLASELLETDLPPKARNICTLLKAACLYKSDRYKSAFELLETLPEDFEARNYALYLQGICMATLKDQYEGKNFFNFILDKDTTIAELWEAYGIYHYFLGRTEEALWDFSKALEFNNLSMTTLLNYGMLLISTGKETMALDYFDRVLEFSPENITAKLYKAYATYFCKDYAQCHLLCRDIIELDEFQGLAWQLLGLSYYRTEDYDSALKSIEKGIERDPGNTDLWNIRGIIMRKLDKPQEESHSYNRAIELDSGNATAWTNKGIWLVELKFYEEALVCFERAIESYPNVDLLWLERGRCHYKMERHQEALRSYNIALEKNFTITALNGKGEALISLERYEEALRILDKSLEQNPSQPIIWNNRGFVLENLAIYEEAVRSYIRAYELEPTSERIIRNIIVVSEELDKTEQAKNFSKRLKSIGADPSFDRSKHGKLIPVEYPIPQVITTEFGIKIDFIFKELPYIHYESNK